mmetsp:Transcript_7954/g.13434  ORF Transcript_7954/g.13434 Transcript_7954/m.13434 type:complete len:81 (+) Transcript_7954:78-320(+)
MSTARPFTLDDLQRWTEEAGKDVEATFRRPVTMEDLLGGRNEEKDVGYQAGHDSSKNNAFDTKKQRGQRLGYGAKKRVKP